MIVGGITVREHTFLSGIIIGRLAKPCIGGKVLISSRQPKILKNCVALVLI